MRVTLYFAFETVQLQEENRMLLDAVRRQLMFLRDLEQQFPYTAARIRDEQTELQQVANRVGSKA